MLWEGSPNSRLSRFVDCRPHLWHMQEDGEGPPILLLHGAGGAVGSFRDVLPLLARRHRTVAVDLPGHGLARLGTRQRQGLDAMSEDLAALLRHENLAPHLIVGHSAGAAIALRLAERLDPPPDRVVGINAALGHFRGLAGWLFPALARMLALNPLTAPAFSRLSSSQTRVRSLLRSTGSEPDEGCVALYGRLISDPAHVDGTLAMMAQWQLGPLLERMPGHAVPVLLVAGESNRAFPPEVSAATAARLPNARVVHLAGLGHLAHEEAPEAVVRLIEGFWEEVSQARCD